MTNNVPRGSPGARAKGLGTKLRRLREQIPMTLRVAAEELGWDKAKLSRIETGQQQIKVEEVALLLSTYKIVDERRDLLLEAARAVDEPGWWEKLGLTEESATLADYEREADAAVEWSLGLIPGRLQTMDYASTFMTLLGIDTEHVGKLLAARLERQRYLADKRAPYTAFIGEAAVRGKDGGRRVMAAQLRALLDLPEHMSVQIVPSDAPAHPGKFGGFLLLRFPLTPVVVHVELLRSAVFHDDPDLTDRYEAAVTQIGGVAMSETESARLIREAWKELEN